MANYEMQKQYFTKIKDGTFDVKAADMNGLRGLQFEGDFGIQFNQIFLNKSKIQHVAAFYGQTQILLDICNHRTDNNLALTETDNVGRTPLHYAAAGGHIDVVMMIVQKTGDLSVKDRNLRSIVHYACQYGHVNILRWANSKGLKLNDNSRDGYPIHLACFHQHFDVIEYLCKHDVDVNQDCTRLDKRITPIEIAIKVIPEAVPLLVLHGADMYVTNLHVPIMFICIQQKNEYLVELLLKLNYDPNRSDSLGWTPLHLACSLFCPKIILLLLEYNANPLAETKEGATPFLLAKNRCITEDDQVILAELQRRIDEKIENENSLPILY